VIVLNALFPIFGLLILGNLLRSLKLTTDSYLKVSDKLVYYIFFPIMLFWKVGGAPHGEGDQLQFVGVTLLAMVTMFVISTLVIRFGPVSSFEAGSFSQSCYRFNTYIGVAVILNSLGEAGIAYFGILIALTIPLVNVFAVAILIWFSGYERDLKKRSLIFIKALIGNPLIIGSFAGAIYARLVGVFPEFIDNTLQLMSMVTLPLALISIGGALSFRGIRKYLPLSLLGACLKLGVFPVVGYLLYALFDIDGVAFRTGMIFFCLPASTTIYVLSSQLNSDTELASASIVASTLLSFASLSVALLL
jgi:predicted permease